MTLGNLRVLVVEDEPTNREIAEVILTSQGHEVVSCRTGQEALDLLVDKGERFDVILMDVLMPGMDGLEVTRRLRTVDRTRDVPIICVSAKASGSDYAAGLAAGANSYLRKPYRRRELLQAIDDVLRGASGPEANGRRAGMESSRAE
ncbi:MAG: response regulator [Candidatus Sericytochromatia bacterium]|nr:response regulator [Candidatus Tanganyikabacteria bacterium]